MKHKPLPHSIEAERAVLCSILLDPTNVLSLCKEKGVNEGFFHIPAHALIFRTMVKLYLTGKPVDIIMITQVLSDSKRIEDAGGAAYITELMGFIATSNRAEHYIEIIRQKAMLKRSIVGLEEVKQLCYEEQGDMEAIGEAAQKALLGVIETTEGREPQKTTSQHVQDIFRRLDEARSQAQETGRKNMRGISSGLFGFDEITGGLQDDAYIALAGQKTQGKTALGLGMAAHVAIDLEMPVGIFSLEMRTQKTLERIISSRSGVNLFHIINGNLTVDEEQSVIDAGSDVSSAQIFIDDQPGLSIMELCAKARRMKAEKKIKLVMIDYLQLIRGLGKRREESKTDEATDVSRILKQLQKELGIPMLVLCQAGDNGKTRWADAIGEDADVMAFIEHREEGSVLNITKNRGGESSTSARREILVPVLFESQFVRFTDREPGEEPQAPTKKRRK